jgi:hypothetical protein
MALVELRRFYDRNEAYIAQSALENAGLGAMVRDNGYANMLYGTAIATGGYGLYVIDEDVAEARQLLLEAVPPAPDALAWGHHPQIVTGIPAAAAGAVSALVAGGGGALVIAAKRRPTPLGYAVSALPIGMILLAIGGVWLLMSTQ